MRYLVEIKYGEDTGHLVKMILSFNETLAQFDAEQN